MREKVLDDKRFPDDYLNFIMGVTATKLMTGTLSRFKPFKNKKLYGYKGGETNE